MFYLYIRGAVGDKFVFMDDNATCHRTLAVQDCLDSEGIQRLVWPARSPDLNPIENVWDALGRQVAGRNYPPTNKNTLIRALTEEWDKLPQQLLDNVVQSTGIDSEIRLPEIPSDSSCAYLKGHLLERAQDLYQIFESALVQNAAMDFAQLKAALRKAFPVIHNKKDLEIKFYESQLRRDQEKTDFVYYLLKLNKKLELEMSEEALADHNFVKLETEVQDYVEVRNPQNTVQQLDVLSKIEERYSYKAIQGSGNSDNVKRRGWNERRMSNADDSRRNWRNSEVVLRPSSGRNDYRVNYKNGGQENH
ncbi:uncharacterized protein TNCV_390621 [Trichonephila clavipes]|nr:uncharacterized protein TNCV_390621 [Trichonephila clavipes]